ncbi:MAG TPA: hydrogenase iron-sulfur subunit [Anaeromyxobacteraceae bacterium]|nr:hydrogenase iron-sulfur subunit [Anaeromyxobacteraceae bacterium]
MSEFEPKIVAFLCNWCTYVAADAAGVSRFVQKPNVRVIRVNCSGMVDPSYVMKAFASGADGVLVGGCHPGDCHYVVGNIKAMRRAPLLKKLLGELGVEELRFRLKWIAASEPSQFAKTVNDMTEEIRKLGPFKRKKKGAKRSAA